MSTYPNPFNPSFNIAYYLKGQKVTVLFDQIQLAGEHKYIWNAEELLSGIHFLKLKNDNITQTEKCHY
ncbi:MAG: hypothetical protein P9X26_09895 [Candidatus Stygibacter frigidus]|nr:hypothetical protein [Candidatus Stygibacter frigidus]